MVTKNKYAFKCDLWFCSVAGGFISENRENELSRVCMEKQGWIIIAYLQGGEV